MFSILAQNCRQGWQNFEKKTQKIITHNFSKFFIIFKTFKILEKNSKIFNLTPKFPTPPRSRHWHQRGRSLLSSQFHSNLHFLWKISKARGIKHNLARSCFQLWPSKSAPRVTKFREKTVSASALPVFFLEILSSWSPILSHNWKHDLSRSFFILKFLF